MRGAMPPSWASPVRPLAYFLGRESNMSLGKISSGALLFSAVLFCFFPLLSAEAQNVDVPAQDVDVPGNLTMVDSTPAVGNILKNGVLFIHNAGPGNTFIGKNAGN